MLFFHTNEVSFEVRVCCFFNTNEVSFEVTVCCFFHTNEVSFEVFAKYFVEKMGHFGK